MPTAKGPQRRPTIDARMKLLIIATIARRPDYYQLVKDRIEPYCFDPLAEPDAIVLWAIVNNLFEVTREELSEEVVLSEFFNISRYDSRITEDMQSRVIETLAKCYSKPTISPSTLDWVKSRLTRWLTDSLAAKAAVDLSPSRGYMVDLDTYASEFQKKVQQTQLITSGVNVDAWEGNPEDWLSEPLLNRSTGISFIDSFMNGGHSDGEINLVLGPYGSCKTLTMIQLIVEQAKQAMIDYVMNGRQGKRPIVVYAFYELSREEFRRRMLSYAAQIPGDFMRSATPQQLSRTGNLKPYELQRWSAQIEAGLDVPGEYERFMNVVELMRDHVILLACSDPNQAMDIDQLAARLQAIKEERNAEIRCVCVDYLGALVELVGSRKTLTDNQRRLMLGHAPLHLRNQIASKAACNCPVWALHQLTAEKNALRPGVLPAVTDAAGAKNLAENADFSFMIGKPTEENRALFGQGKIRRVGRIPAIVIQIDGVMNRVSSTDGQYVLDERTKQIVSAREMNVISTPAQLNMAARNRRGPAISVADDD